MKHIMTNEHRRLRKIAKVASDFLHWFDNGGCLSGSDRDMFIERFGDAVGFMPEGWPTAEEIEAEEAAIIEQLKKGGV